ncbi:hypothetical protein APHAL10511_005195 [Amanita phalloides]|nr:hypothetical protein APHAL10511_005195 [Amanita phalloides]
MKGHAENKEELMIRCSYPGCEYKSLQKSNVVSHTRKHGFSKAYPCPFPNCIYFTLYSRSLTEHMLETHGYVRSSRGKKSKQVHKLDTGCLTAHDLSCLEYGAVENGESSSLVSDIELSNEILGVLGECSGSNQQQLLLHNEGSPPQLMHGQFPFYQSQPFYPPVPNNTPTIALNGITMPSIISSDAYYVPGPDQMPVQQQFPVPMMNTPFQISPPLPSPASSFSSSSFPDSGTDFPAELQCPLTPLPIQNLKLDAFFDSSYPNSLLSTGLSPALENTAFSTDYPNFMTGFTPAGPVPWFCDPSFAPSTDFNYGSYNLLYAPEQEFNFDFNQFL